MKYIYCFLLLLFLPSFSKCQIITDPGLAGSIEIMDQGLRKSFKTRSKHHTALISVQTTMSGFLADIKSIQEKTLNYLSNASSAVNDLYSVKKIGELLAVEIPKNIASVLKESKRFPKNAILATLCSDYVKSIQTDIVTISPLLAKLVKGKVDDLSGKENKINLLNAAERSYIVTTILSTLEDINFSLYFLKWQLSVISLNDLFFHISPEIWINYLTINQSLESTIKFAKEILN